jgi:Tol biopolymer transport system component
MSANGGAPVAITSGTKPEYRPAWSPDGASVAFLRQGDRGEYQLVIASVLTHSEKLVRTQPLPASITGEPPALDWSPDGSWLVTNEQQGSGPVYLLLVSLPSGHAERITDPPNASTGDIEARFSPDGRRIAFRRGGMGDLWVASVDGAKVSDARQVTFDNPGVRGLCWSADGKAIYFGGLRGGNVFGIWRLDLDGGDPVRLTPAGVEALSPALAPDGRLAFVHPTVDVNIWRYDVAAPGRSTEIAASTRMEFQPAWSPDDKQVAFISDRSGPREIWTAAADGSRVKKITSLNGNGFPVGPAWSPDGKSIVFFCRRNGLNYAIQVPSDGGQERILEGGPSYALEPQYSADGRWLYYSSNAGGRFRIWRKSVDGSGAGTEVTAEDSEFFKLSRDGRWLYFLRSGAPSQLVGRDLSTDQQNVVWTWPAATPALGGWDISGKSLYFLRGVGDGFAQITVADMNTREEKVLGNVRTAAWESGLAISHDGRYLLVSQVDRDDTEVMYLNLDRLRR